MVKNSFLAKVTDISGPKRAIFGHKKQPFSSLRTTFFDLKRRHFTPLKCDIFEGQSGHFLMLFLTSKAAFLGSSIP